MIFLEKDDFKTIIEETYLDQILGNDDSLLDDVELFAIESVACEIDGRYDTDIIFAETGTDRNSLIIRFLARIILHELFSRINPSAVPDEVKDRYTDVMNHLKRINRQETTPRGLPNRVDADGEAVDWLLIESRKPLGDYEY